MAKIYTPTTWVDEVLAGNERFSIQEDDGSAFKSAMRILLETAVTQAGTTVNASRMNNIENGIDGLDTLLSNLLDGWIAGGTWTYASATTFTVSGDVRSLFPVGTKIKLTQTSVKYFYVVSTAYSSPTTTVTITGGSDYSLANAAIASPYYSYLATPKGFPQWFTWLFTVTQSGTVTYTVNRCKFCISGRQVEIEANITITGSGTMGNLVSLSSLPVTQLATANNEPPLGIFHALHGGTSIWGFARPAGTSSNTGVVFLGIDGAWFGIAFGLANGDVLALKASYGI